MSVNQEHTASDWRNILECRQQEILQTRDAEIKQKKSQIPSQSNNEIDAVKLIDKNYFLHKDFQATESEAQQLIDNTVVKYSLNEEQERAFRIVANHAVQPSGEHNSK